jgi:hypothetical protein
MDTLHLLRQTGLIRLLVLIGHLCLSGVDLRTYTATCVKKEIGVCAQNVLIVLGSIVNIIPGWGGGYIPNY